MRPIMVVYLWTHFVTHYPQHCLFFINQEQKWMNEFWELVNYVNLISCDNCSKCVLACLSICMLLDASTMHDYLPLSFHLSNDPKDLNRRSKSWKESQLARPQLTAKLKAFSSKQWWHYKTLLSLQSCLSNLWRNSERKLPCINIVLT